MKEDISWTLKLLVAQMAPYQQQSTETEKTHTDLDFTSHHTLQLAVVNTPQSKAKTHCTFVNDRTTEEL